MTRKGQLTPHRICSCGKRKAYYAKSCRACYVPEKPLLGKRGANHPTWKGGFEIDRDGYVRTYAPDHPWPRRNGYVLEHVRVMELELGRRLRPDECVHHRDHDRRNNTRPNLELMLKGAHSKHHRRLQLEHRRDAQGRFA